EQRLDRDLGLDPGEGCADAQVDAPAEADVMAGFRSVEADLVGPVVDSVVTGGGGACQQRVGSSGGFAGGGLRVAGGGAGGAAEGRVVAEGFFDEGRHQRRVAAQLVLQLGSLGENAGGGSGQAGG